MHKGIPVAIMAIGLLTLYLAAMAQNSGPQDIIPPATDDGQVVYSRSHSTPILQSERQSLALPQIPDKSAFGINTVWESSTVPVCWEDMRPENADGRAWTRSAVEGTWSQVADIQFTGWGDCADDAAGINIAVAEAGPNVAVLGRALDGMPAGMTLNFTFKTWGKGCAGNREFCIRTLAVHEFGHAIGIAHEHNRTDKSLCNAEMQGPNPAYLMTEYDPSSVMNYCAQDWNNNGKLSALDVAGVRLIYGPYSDDLPAKLSVSGVAVIAGDNAEEEVAIDAHFKLTDDIPQQTQTQWICNDNDLLIRLDMEASLIEGFNSFQLESHATLFDSENCNQGGAETGSQSSNAYLIEPYQPVLSFLTFSAPEDQAHINAYVSLNAQRIVGKVADGEGCVSCAAAAAETAFTSGSSPDTSDLD